MLKRLLIILFLLGLPAIANAELIEPKIVVVNVKQVMKESLAAQDANKQLETKRSQYQAQITAEEGKLKSAEEELIEKKNILSKDALIEKQKDFMKQINDVRSDVQKKKINLDNAYKNALNEIQTAMTEVIEGLAVEQGFNIAMPTAQLVYATADMDITDEVVKRLNAKLPKAKIKF